MPRSEQSGRRQGAPFRKSPPPLYSSANQRPRLTRSKTVRSRASPRTRQGPTRRRAMCHKMRKRPANAKQEIGSASGSRKPTKRSHNVSVIAVADSRGRNYTFCPASFVPTRFALRKTEPPDFAFGFVLVGWKCNRLKAGCIFRTHAVGSERREPERGTAELPIPP